MSHRKQHQSTFENGCFNHRLVIFYIEHRLWLMEPDARLTHFFFECTCIYIIYWNDIHTARKKKLREKQSSIEYFRKETTQNTFGSNGIMNKRMVFLVGFFFSNTHAYKKPSSIHLLKELLARKTIMLPN